MSRARSKVFAFADRRIYAGTSHGVWVCEEFPDGYS